MSIRNTDVEKILVQQRMTSSSKDFSLLVEQLTLILSYRNKLNEIDTTQVQAASFSDVTIRGPGRILRNDLVLSSLGQELAIKNAPLTDKGYFLVPKVIGN
jgi:aspartyl-tRNA(Asn)/glutamyl-tRNA(Gln) amidotransferase subunit C